MKKLPKSTRIHIRAEKRRINREMISPEEKLAKIKSLYEQAYVKYKSVPESGGQKLNDKNKKAAAKSAKANKIKSPRRQTGGSKIKC